MRPNVFRVYSSMHFPAASWQKQCIRRTELFVFSCVNFSSHRQCLTQQRLFITSLLFSLLLPTLGPIKYSALAYIGDMHLQVVSVGRQSNMDCNNLLACESVIVSILYAFNMYCRSGQLVMIFSFVFWMFLRCMMCLSFVCGCF